MKKIILVIILTLTTMACSGEPKSDQEIRQENQYQKLLQIFKASNNNLTVNICVSENSHVCYDWITYTIKTENDLYEYYINNF